MVPNAVEILPKIWTAWVGRSGARTLQTTDDRQTTDRQTDGRQHIANVKNVERVKHSPHQVTLCLIQIHYSISRVISSLMNIEVFCTAFCALQCCNAVIHDFTNHWRTAL